MKRTCETNEFPAILQRFFSEYLISQRDVSPHTVSAYRDTFCLLLRFLERELGIHPVALKLQDLTALRVVAFLDDLEQSRGNCVRSRNSRLAAIRSFLQYAAASNPGHLSSIRQVIAIPFKRFSRPILGYLSREEVEAIIRAPDQSTWSGRRDRVLFSTLYNTGARVSEILSLRQESLAFRQSTATVLIEGKGRKQRTVPLWKSTARQLRAWLRTLSNAPKSPLFANSTGATMSRSGVEHRLREAVAIASKACPSLLKKNISPHTFRHTTAMHLLQAGVDLTVIALWLGHESPTTTHMYVEADLTLKEKAIGRVQESTSRITRYRPSDSLIRFLEAL